MLRSLLFLFFAFFSSGVFSQRIIDSSGRTVVTDTIGRGTRVDSLGRIAQPIKDKKVDSVLRVHSPRKAIIRSAILPGWGQIYNKKYWKLPIVYGALGVTGYIFFDNVKTYRDLRFAYRVLYDKDTANWANVDPRLLPLVQRGQLTPLRSSRDQFRRYIDYSVLFFFVFWGLNVVDAAVDAHLKSFDVSPELSLRVVPGYSEMARTNGVSIVLAFK